LGDHGIQQAEMICMLTGVSPPKRAAPSPKYAVGRSKLEQNILVLTGP